MFFSRKEAEVDSKKIVAAMLACMMNDQLLVPLYIDDIKTEADAERLGIAPVIYVWNENRAAGSFSVSVNGKAIGHLLEALVPRSHRQFTAIRDEVMAVVSKLPKKRSWPPVRKWAGSPATSSVACACKPKQDFNSRAQPTEQLA